MGYEAVDRRDALTRYAIKGGNGADFVAIEVLPDATSAREGAGSAHPVAFAVEDRAAQIEVRTALIDLCYNVPPVIDRNYFRASQFPNSGGGRVRGEPNT